MYTITVFYSINDSDSELIMKHGAVTVINVFNANLYLSIRLIYWKIRDSRPIQLKTLIFTNVHDFVDHIKVSVVEPAEISIYHVCYCRRYSQLHVVQDSLKRHNWANIIK